MSVLLSESGNIFVSFQFFPLFFVNLHTFQQGKTRFWDCTKKKPCNRWISNRLLHLIVRRFYDWIEGWNHVVYVACCLPRRKHFKLQTWIQMRVVCVLFLQVYCSLVQYYFLRDWCHWSKHSSRKLVFPQKNRNRWWMGWDSNSVPIAPPKSS